MLNEMKHLKHINENTFNSIVADPTVNEILNIARDEGYSVVFNEGRRFVFIYFNQPNVLNPFVNEEPSESTEIFDVEKFKQCVIDIHRRLLHHGINIPSISERLINRYNSYSSAPLKDINDFNTRDHNQRKTDRMYHTTICGIRFEIY